MELILNIGIRFLLYIVILLPLVRGIFRGTGNVFSMIIALAVVGVAASILETRGLTKKIVAFVSKLLGVGLRSSNSALSNTLGEAIAPEESYIECANCGTSVKLLNGQGKCPSCDTPMNIKQISQ